MKEPFEFSSEGSFVPRWLVADAEDPANQRGGG
jgi:hypothetical protein